MEWLKFKNYPHIDLPLEPKSTFEICKYITDPNKITSHPFLPLIRRTITNRSYKKNDKGIRKPKVKDRKITYASHFDSAIYSYYAAQLQERYELFLTYNHLSDIVVAYRKISKKEGESGKSNIDIANDVFEYIRSEIDKGNDVAAITFDIKGFFDNLDHKIIKSTWKQILGCKELSSDIYAVYKSITNYSYIREDKLFDECKNALIRKSNNRYITKSVKAKKYMRDNNIVAFCYKDNINALRNKNLINSRSKSAKGKVGIPQGLPISATIANVYMANFDIKLKNKIRTINGMYKRYSDDLIIVCPADKCDEIKIYVMNLIKDVNLKIQEKKTNAYIFSKNNGKITCLHETDRENRVLEYLGFSFDGRRKMLKSAGLSRYYIKMKRIIKRSQVLATNIENEQQGKIFTNRLLKRFSHLGAKPHVIHFRSNVDHSKFIINKNRRSFGNFTSYARRASNIMNEPAIIKQLRRNKHKLNKYIDNAYRQIDKGLYAKAMRKI